MFETREWSWIAKPGIDNSDKFVEVSFGSLPYIFSPWFDKSPEKQYSLRDMLEIYLARMESESELLYQKVANNRNTRFQIFSVYMNQDEVIYISSIIFHFQSFLHEDVELMHIDICEELTREIPDRETTSFCSIKQALIARESDPVYTISSDDNSFSDVGKDDASDEIEHDLLII